MYSPSQHDPILKQKFNDFNGDFFLAVENL